MSCLVHGLHVVCCLFQELEVDTLGNTLSGCVTQDPRLDICAIHPTHPSGGFRGGKGGANAPPFGG